MVARPAEVYLLIPEWDYEASFHLLSCLHSEIKLGVLCGQSLFLPTINAIRLTHRPFQPPKSFPKVQYAKTVTLSNSSRGSSTDLCRTEGVRLGLLGCWRKGGLEDYSLFVFYARFDGYVYLYIVSPNPGQHVTAR